MKKYKLFAIILSIFILLVGCNKSEKVDESGGESSVSASMQDNVKRNIYISTSGAWGELESNGYISNSTSEEYLNADEYLNFDSMLLPGGVDKSLIEQTKKLEFNGESYDLVYEISMVFSQLSFDIEAFKNDTKYDMYYFNKGKSDQVIVMYNRSTGKVHRISFTDKDIEPNENFTHETARALADKLIPQFTDDFFQEYDCIVHDANGATPFTRVKYIRKINGYLTEQAIFVDFNNDGSLRDIMNGKIGFFSNSKCQISALDYYEPLLSEELLKNAENQLKKMCPKEVLENEAPIIGFDSNGNCLLHVSYAFEENEWVKYYVNLFEIEEKSEVASK